jgi:hypothetical protein
MKNISSPFKITVMNGTVGIGDRIIWPSKRFGIRKGVITKLVQEKEYTGYSTRLSVHPDKNPGERFIYNVALSNFPYICKEFASDQLIT